VAGGRYGPGQLFDNIAGSTELVVLQGATSLSPTHSKQLFRAVQ
jgi:hypothetical protein